MTQTVTVDSLSTATEEEIIDPKIPSKMGDWSSFLEKLIESEFMKASTKAWYEDKSGFNAIEELSFDDNDPWGVIIQPTKKSKGM